ncbi:MAG: hypothetical protein H5T83_05805 [Actinotalea sp.]|nr:hypothetical protein [Actinotalea sp.]
MAGRLRRLSLLTRDVPVLVVTAFGLAVTYISLVSLFVVGLVLTDPGGWTGLGIALGYALLLLGLAALALFRPLTAAVGVSLLSLGPLGLAAWTLLDHTAMRGWEDGVGPVGLALTMVAASGAAVIGLQRPAAGGAFLLLVTVVPAALAVGGAGAGWASELMIGFITAPLAVAGGIFVVAAYEAAHPGPRLPKTLRVRRAARTLTPAA